VRPRELNPLAVNVHEDWSRPRPIFIPEAQVLRAEPAITVTIQWEDQTETTALRNVYGLTGQEHAHRTHLAIMFGMMRRPAHG
jgi:hypothetical protein